MTKTIISTAAILFAATAYAADSRQQFISDNPDSDNSRGFYQGVTAVAPGFGADIDRYQGLADDNPDLFAAALGTAPPHERPDIYGPLGASPDVTY
jgi:hypothetical protein